MRNLFLSIILIFALVISTPFILSAKTGYVSDMLLLTLREGPGKTFSIIKSLHSNEVIQILEEQEKYLKVSTNDGEIGWVDKQYIVFNIPKTIIIKQLNKQISDLETNIENLEKSQEPLKVNLETQKSEFQSKIQELEERLAEKNLENKKIKNELKSITDKYNNFLENAKNVQKIMTLNEKLDKENKELSQNLEHLEAQSDDILKQGMMKWSLAGFGILLCGYIIGKSIIRKKSYSSSLLK